MSVDLYRLVLKELDWEIVLDGIPPGLTGKHVGRARIVLWKSKKSEN